MKNSGLKKVCYGYLVLASIFLPAFNSHASAETLDSVSHIHQVKMVENKVLVLTHEGLYELVSKNNMKLVGKEKIDVMGFTSVGKTLFASGHPAQGSKAPNPIGLMKSINGGLSWTTVSQVGKIDFHFLEGARSDLYGADSQSGNLMHSADSGKSWSSLGANPFTDIAVSPDMPGVAVALKGPKLLLTKDAFKSTKELKNSFKFTQIEWRKSGLYALSGVSLYKSTNSGNTWTTLSTFNDVPGILSASDQVMLVTVGSDIYTSSNAGKKFKIVS